MAEVSAVRDEESEVSRKGVAEEQASLGETVGALGHDIKEAWQSVADAFSETEEDVKEKLEATAGEIGGAARETALALGWAFNFPAHVRRHPWLLMAGAVLLGVLVGRLAGGRRR